MKITTYGLGGYDTSLPNNNIIEEIDVPDESQLPLDTTGSLATLLAVNGIISVQDAANAVGLTPTDLENEALAWGVASNANFNND